MAPSILKIGRIYKIITLNRNYSTHVKSTILSNEIENFDNLAKFWWNGGVPGLHTFNKIRVPFMQEGLISTKKLKADSILEVKPFKGITILDAGCGGGILTEALALQGADILGLDASAGLIKCAKEHAGNTLGPIENLRYICSTIEDFSQKNQETFDAVVSSEVVEHIDSVELFLEHCIQILKPGGSLFVTTINRTIRSLFMSILFREYIFKTLPMGSHTWKQCVTPNELRYIVEKNNCEVLAINGWEINNSNYEWRKINHLSKSYGLHAVKK